MMKKKVNEITINWLTIDKEGNPKFEFRNFKDEKKASEFVETKLSQRNVVNFVEKKKCSFVEEANEQAPGQLTMDI